MSDSPWYSLLDEHDKIGSTDTAKSFPHTINCLAGGTNHRQMQSCSCEMQHGGVTYSATAAQLMKERGGFRQNCSLTDSQTLSPDKFRPTGFPKPDPGGLNHHVNES